MRILAIDTALGHCAACVTEAGEGEPLASETLAMERGHAEALLPLLDRVMTRAPGGFAALDRVAVTIGPGSFTGLRVGIACARAVGLAGQIPVVGVTTLAALMAPLFGERRARLVVAVIDARGGRVFAQAVAAEARGIGLDAKVYEAGAAPHIEWVARLGAVADEGTALPKPLYLAPPDARPQDAARIPRL